MPERWDLRGIIWFVLQILGLTWARGAPKAGAPAGRAGGGGLEAGFQLLQEIRERGLVQALRDRVTEFFGNLRESALGAIRGFIQQRLVMAGIQQLLSLLSPVGAIIQAIIKTYTTVQFFIQRINQILDLVESIVDSIAAIASGAIARRPTSSNAPWHAPSGDPRLSGPLHRARRRGRTGADHDSQPAGERGPDA